MNSDGVCWVGIDPGAAEGDRTVISCAALACPFCGGPPCCVVTNAGHPYGVTGKLEDYGDNGRSVRAVVYCHSCGSEGPDNEAELFDSSDYINAKLRAFEYWNKRGMNPELEGRVWSIL